MKNSIVGKLFTTDSGEQYKVLATDLPEILCGEDISDGWLLFFVDPRIKDGHIYSRTTYGFAVTKKEFFDKLGKIQPENYDADALTEKLQKTYYRIPTRLLRLVSETYLSEISDSRSDKM